MFFINKTLAALGIITSDFIENKDRIILARFKFSIACNYLIDNDYQELFKLKLRKIYNTVNEEKRENVEQYQSKMKELEGKIERL